MCVCVWVGWQIVNGGGCCYHGGSGEVDKSEGGALPYRKQSRNDDDDYDDNGLWRKGANTT